MGFAPMKPSLWPYITHLVTFLNRISPTDFPEEAKIETENADWKADGMDLQYVRVYAVDSNGRKVPTATEELTFDVTGAARLIAVDNGDHSSNDLFAGNKKLLHKGFAMAILRSEQTTGTIKLRVTAGGLKGIEQTLIVK